MRSKRNRFSRLGVLSIALLLALCVTGVGYAAWMDEVSIEGTANLGYVEVVLSSGACSDPQITCSVSAPHTLVVTLTNAQAGTHTCGFTITNTGTIPVKIQSIVTSGFSNGVEVSVLGVVKGMQIEQAGVYPDSIDGMVQVIVLESYIVSCSFEVAFSFVQWNMYIE
ncbi:MAG TPA: hypothetical protein VMW50_02620 [Dehalococcoidia bacterium]|nr:hypothetical protein [Dehalococcoidia bacterium]